MDTPPPVYQHSPHISSVHESWMARETVPVPAIKNRPQIGRQVMRLLKQRFLGFGLVGIAVMLAGLAFIALLVQVLHVEPNLAYFFQAVFSIELNFILNRTFNWRDRKGKIWPQWVKFNTTKIGTVVLNQVLFALLVTSLHQSYLLATVFCVGVTTVLNYIINDRFVFNQKQTETTRVLPTSPFAGVPLPALPRVGIVIPVFNSAHAIRQCLHSVFAQTYQGEWTIFLVGNRPEHDTTWSALADLLPHPRVRRVYLEKPANWRGRDSNEKRWKGAQLSVAAGMDLVAMLDSQVEVPSTWLEDAVALFHKEPHIGALAGISRRHTDDKSFANLYQDMSLFSEWPRYGEALLLDPHHREQVKKLPITANMFLTRTAMARLLPYWSLDCPYGWDDYGLAYTMLSLQVPILCTDRLVVYRNHKKKLRIAKQFSSGMGAMNFHWQQSDKKYSTYRLVQALAFLMTMLGAYTGAIALVFLFGSTGLLIDVVAGALGWAILAALSFRKARDLRALVFPFLDILHISFWVAGLATMWIKGKHAAVALANSLQHAR